MDRWDEGSWDKDPIRHGRFIAIEDQRGNGLYKAETTDALLTIPSDNLFRTRYEDIHHQLALFIEVKKSLRPIKSMIFGLT